MGNEKERLENWFQRNSYAYVRGRLNCFGPKEGNQIKVILARLVAESEDYGVISQSLFTPSFGFISVPVDTNELLSLIETKQKIVEVNDEQLILDFGLFTSTPYVWDSFKVSNFDTIELKWPTLIFRLSGSNNFISSSIDLKKLEQELKSAEKPHSSFNDAVQQLIGINEPFNEHHYPTFDCIFPVSVSLGSVAIEDGKLSFTVFAHNKYPEKIFLGIVGYGEDPVIRKRQEVPCIGEEIGVFTKITFSTTLPKCTSGFVALTDGKSQVFGESFVIDRKMVKNSRLVAHLEVGEQKVLSFLENPQPENAGLFERAIADLLHFAGFSSQPLGRGDSPDVLAFSTNPEIIVVGECTNKEPIEGKIDKLAARAKKLRNKVGIELLPILFIVEEQMSEGAMRKIKEEQISVMKRDDIRELFQLVKASPMLQKVIQKLKSGKIS